MIKIKKKMRSRNYSFCRGFSYIEVVICMALISIFVLGLANSYFSIKKNFVLAEENYFADVAVENILNLAESEFNLKKSINNILDENEYDKIFLDDNFYRDKFNFNIRLNEIDENFIIKNNSLEEINPDNEDFLLIDTEITCDNKNLFDIINLDSDKKKYLLTVDLYNKNHKFLKRLIKILQCSD